MNTVQGKRAVPGMPLAALDAIGDQNTRDVLRALVDAHHVRNGQIGDGNERFITAKELTAIKSGSGVDGSSASGSDKFELKPTDVGRIVAELQAQIIESALFKELGRRVDLLDAPLGTVGKIKQDLLDAANKALAEFDAANAGIGNGVTALTQLFDGAIKQTQAIKQTLYAPGGTLPLASAAILAINDVSVSSASANARTLAGLSASFNDPTTGLYASRADYVSRITVEAALRKAVADKLDLLSVQVNDPTTGLAASRADYLSKYNLVVAANSATAKALDGLTANVIDPKTGKSYAEGMIATDRSITLTNLTAMAQQTNAVYAALGTKNRTFFSSSAPPVVAAVAGSAYVPATATTAARPAVLPQEGSPIVGDIWYDTSNNNIARRWNGSAWVDTSDVRAAAAAGLITREENVRLSQDNAIVSAIQTVWAALGGNSGLIQGGQTVTVNTAGAAATAFNQVQAAMKDGNGNLISSAAIKQTTEVLVSKSGQVETKWVVDLDSGGAATGFRQAGFGIAGSPGAGGPVYSFGVRADQFWIASPGDWAGVNVPSQKVPFIVKTGSWTDSQGYVQPAGVYLNELFATTAKIGTAQIGTAHIKDAAIGTLKLAGASVMVGVYDQVGASSIPASNGWINAQTLITRQVDLGDGYNSGVIVNGVVSLNAPRDATYGIRVLVNGAIAGEMRGSLHAGYNTLAPVTGFMAGVGRFATVQLQVYNAESGPGSNIPLNVGAATQSIMGGKR